MANFYDDGSSPSSTARRSFHVGVVPCRGGGFEHAAAMPSVPPPEDLPNDQEIKSSVLPIMPDRYAPIRA